MNFLNNFIKIKAEINNLNKKVNLIVITKNQDFMNIKPIIDQGHLHFGENRVQDALAKWESYLKLNNKINLHFVGKLQSNKIKQAISLFNYIHSLDSEKLAIALHKEETSSGKKIKYFIQVNIGGEVQKSGVLKSELSTFLNFCKNNTRLDIIGLMCIPPNDDKSLKYFKEIKQLAKEFNFSAKFIELAGEVNTSMPKWVVNKICEKINILGLRMQRAKILILGLAYKKNVNDLRESPSVNILNYLNKFKPKLYYHDPFFRGNRYGAKYFNMNYKDFNLYNNY